MLTRMKSCLKDQSGATAIEYCLIAGLIGFVIIAAVTLLGADLQGTFQGLADTF